MGSQIGDDRPIAQVRFSPNSQILATGIWAGNVKLCNVPSCTPIRTMRGHTDRIGGVAWHPQATLSQCEDYVNLVSGAGDANLHFWSLNRSVQSMSPFLYILLMVVILVQRDTVGDIVRTPGPSLSCCLPSFWKLRRECEFRHDVATVGRKHLERTLAPGGPFQGSLFGRISG